MKAHTGTGILYTIHTCEQHIPSTVYIQSIQVWISGCCFCKLKDGVCNECQILVSSAKHLLIFRDVTVTTDIHYLYITLVTHSYPWPVRKNIRQKSAFLPNSDRHEHEPRGTDVLCPVWVFLYTLRFKIIHVTTSSTISWIVGVRW